ncbi:MAG: hypothetical protein HC919_11745 [Oscillatoriales cyanobacterium SM2_2_1]|nr:hypothetical protein [Oscillatoriales cyanobacterium SM2_2_1]
MKFCLNCRFTQNLDDHRFCINCGKELYVADRQIKTIAKATSGWNGEFSDLLDHLELDAHSLIGLQNSLEKKLHSILQPKSRKTFAQLIKLVEDGKLFSEQSVQLCHTIRKLRNRVAHSSEAKMNYQAEVMCCLFAAAFIWNEISDL